MTDDKQKQVDSGWTTETLLKLMDERDRRYQEVLTERDLRYEQLHRLSEQAIKVAETNTEKWQDNANEWRSAMNDRERDFLPRNVGYIIGFLTVVSLVLAIFFRLK